MVFSLMWRISDAADLPVIVAHRDASILDVPAIYRWNGSHFVNDSKSHPNFYRLLLVQDKENLPADTSAVVLVNLSRIAVLSGDPSGARTILADALSRERGKGSVQQTRKRFGSSRKNSTPSSSTGPAGQAVMKTMPVPT